MSKEPISPQTASHPLRLAFRMIVGAFAGFVIGIAMYRQSMGAEPFVRSAQMIGYVIAGAAIGLCVELFMRRDESTKREFLLTALVFGLVAIFWALIR